MKPLHLLPTVVVACLGLWGCDADKTTGTMDDTNQSASARIFLPNLEPAANATVQVWKSDDTLRSPTTETKTDADGSFLLGAIPDGLYRIVARKDGMVAMQDSLRTVAGRLNPRNDTLAKPAVATGTVKMTGSDNPATVTVLVVGTDSIFPVENSGTFHMDGLAAGTYRLRLSTTIPNYTTTTVVVRIASGKATDIGTIRMNFTGIPPVDSLKASLDTVKSHVVLTWKLPEVQDFRFVRVYREPLDGSEKRVLVGYSTGTSFRDSGFEYSKTNKEWLYTTFIHTLDGDSGYAAWTKVTQKPVQRRVAMIMTYMEDFDRYAFEPDSLEPKTIHNAWVVVYSSPDRPTSLSWSFQGRNGSISPDSIDATLADWTAYADSFRIPLRLDSTTGDFPFVVRMETKNDGIVYDSVTIRVRAPRDTSAKDTTWRDTVHGDTTTIPRDTVHGDTTTVPRDTVHGDTAIVPRDTNSVLHLRIVNQSADTVVAGTRMNLMFVASSAPYRALSVSLHWNGSSKDTAFPGLWDSSRSTTPRTDSLGFAVDVGTKTGPMILTATVYGRNGIWYTDSIRVFVTAPKSKSVAAAPILVPATTAEHAAPQAPFSQLACVRRPDQET